MSVPLPKRPRGSDGRRPPASPRPDLSPGVPHGVPSPPARPELLRAATWRAARYGVNGDLVDVTGRRSLPSRRMIAALLDFVGPALDEFGEREEVADLVERTLRHGTGAARQRRAFARAGRPEDVVDYIVEQTNAG
ncbi:MAG TPA: hypothetical protein VET24_06560 [Actinomycetota bacterium]|nr:hypothetical protein [Actinomycetota bacterium]